MADVFRWSQVTAPAVFFLLFTVAAPAAAEIPARVWVDLENVIGRRLSAPEREALLAQNAALSRRARPSWPSDPAVTNADVHLASTSATSASTTLFCAMMDFDIFVGSSLSGCVDTSFNHYMLISAGAGLSVGISVSAFTLRYRSYDGAEIPGTYLGGRWSFALGRWGGAVGVYFRANAKRKRWRPKNRIYWLGYVAGAVFDISSSVLHVVRL
jgi:hypothetical protein